MQIPPLSPQRSRSRPIDDRESAMPEYLHESLDSLRSQMSSTRVYHVTINQPANVTIGTPAAGASGDEVVKNVMVNEDFDQ